MCSILSLTRGDNPDKQNKGMNKMNIYDAAKVLNVSGAINNEIVKLAFRLACKKYHPDINPAAGEDMMKLINAAYEVLKDYIGDIQEQENNYSELLNNALSAIADLSLDVEVCGAWVWITGDTKTHKEALKAAGFKWANQKKAWYYRPAGYKSRNRSGFSLDDIRNKYGSCVPTGAKGYRLTGV